jgi:hypothetical protein
MRIRKYEEDFLESLKPNVRRQYYTRMKLSLDRFCMFFENCDTSAFSIIEI